MGNPLDLLRLLEPAVRPGNLPGPTKPPAGPIESRSFEELLGEARATTPGGEASAAAPAPEGGEDDTAASKPGPRGPLAGLAQFDRIENPALRQIIAAPQAAPPQ